MSSNRGSEAKQDKEKLQMSARKIEIPSKESDGNTSEETLF